MKTGNFEENNLIGVTEVKLINYNDSLFILKFSISVIL